MTRRQFLRFEVFVRVSGFGVDHKDLFPNSSAAGGWFAKITAIVDEIEQYLKARVLARVDARRVKAETRRVVRENMLTIAGAARRVMRDESGENPFVMPGQRTTQAMLTAARVFVDEATRRQEQFVRFGLSATFISEFQALVNQLDQAAETRQHAKTSRREAQASIETALERGFDVIRDLEPAVVVATRQHPAVLAAWHTARRIERGSHPKAEQPKTQAPGTVPAVVVAQAQTPDATPDPDVRKAS